MAWIFVDREAGAARGDLEQHAAGLLEVHRLEPEPIDHVGGVSARALDLRAHGELLVEIVDRPGEMMDRADAPGAAPFAGRLADVDDAGRVGEAVPRPA